MDQYIDRRSLPALAEKFAAAQNFIIGFPLYVDAMPGSVKEFFEILEPCMGKANNPALNSSYKFTLFG